MSENPCIHPGVHAAAAPKRPAIIMGESGEIISFSELEARSRRLSQLFRSHGLKAGDAIAILMENRSDYLIITWAAQRSGLYFTPVNWHLKIEEAAYVIEDCGAKLLIASHTLGELSEEVSRKVSTDIIRYSVGGPLSGYQSLEGASASMTDDPIKDESEGMVMFYSSGTTGYPKGIKRKLAGNPYGTPGVLEGLMQMAYGFTNNSVYLCPGPLYHAAPLAYSMATQRLGGTVVVMEKFKPESVLQLIEQHKITHAQFVPTHFIRMLHLDKATRARYDLSSLQAAIHAAAPCPIEVKEQMIKWWGPKIFEYYAGSEGNGFCIAPPNEWLTHKGTVGRSILGPVHIVGDNGEELPPLQEGLIYFEGTEAFEYHNAPEKTAEAYHEKGWSTLGDIGYLDEDGYLYLTDRKSHMIISGGVNIYPQEVENALALHEAIADVAVIGVPNPDFGEEVKAIVELRAGKQASDNLIDDIIQSCRAKLAHYKCPKSVDFIDELPRLPNGKLLKRELRKSYWDN